MARTPIAPPNSVAFVLAGLGAGGAERVVSLIADAWARAGRRITIITFDGENEASFHALPPGIVLRRLAIPAPRGGGVAALATTVRRVVALRRALRATDADVIVSFLTKINVLTLLACLFTRQRVAISERNNPRRQEKSRLWTAALAALSWRADAIVMQTDASLACLGAAGRRRATVIGNPIELGAVDRGERAAPVLAAAGRLTHQKGFDLLVDAFVRIAPRHPDWRLVIWGEGEARVALEARIAASGFAGRIELPGNSDRPEQWVASADAFVLSSRYEGFPNVLGEAMAGGLAVVAFACAFGPTDLIRDGVDGLLVPAEDVDALATALDRLMGDAVLRDRLGRAAQAAMRRYDPAMVIAQWDRLLAGLPGPARAPVNPARPRHVVAHPGSDPDWSTGCR